MIRGLIFVIVVAGCGRLRFEPHDGRVGDIGDGAGPDACTFSAFGAPSNVVELNSNTDEYGPWLSNDKRDLYFSSGRTGNQLIYHAHRAVAAGAFDAPVPLNSLISQGNADDPFITDDGLQMVFENSATTLGKDQQLFLAVRANTGVEFANGAQLANVNVNNLADASASLTADGLTMIFSSMRPGPGNWDLYITTRPTIASAFTAPVALSLDTPGVECCSSLSTDGSSMIMISDASGAGRVSTSARVGGVYQPPTELDPVLAGLTGGESDPTLTRDGTTIVFSSNRAGGMGGYDVYIAERSCQ